MISLLRHVLYRNYSPLNTIIISKQNLIDNYQYISRIDPKIKVAPVLKSNAYGHGISGIATVLDPLNPPFFCVDSIYEAYQLLKLKVKTPILIMGYMNPENLRVKRLPFNYCLSNLTVAKAVSRYQFAAGVHIFVDTGMNREGIKVAELAEFIKELKKLPGIRIEGLMTHLASADNPESPVTKLQLQNFETAKQICKQEKINIKWFHLGGSMALLNNKGIKCNLVRVGKAIYGAGDFTSQIRPVLKLTSQVIQIKEIKRGQEIGYNETFKASKNMKIGILPIGYNDGVDRRLSNKGAVSVSGSVCPIVGLVSMNLTTIDVTRVPDIYEGQEAIIFSDQSSDFNSINNVAKTCGTMPLDLLVHLNPSIRRNLLK